MEPGSESNRSVESAVYWRGAAHGLTLRVFAVVFGFRKKQQLTFKQRVSQFWEWYADAADRFYQTIERDQCEQLSDEVGDFVSQTLPSLSWVFGPGENDGHSFTLTGEGYVPKQLLAEYWRSCAPTLPHWTFYASRQPTPISELQSIAISIGDEGQIDAEHFLLNATVNEEREAIDVIAWHPMLEQIPTEHHFTVLFILLDEALGEFGTQMWLGEIKIEPFSPTDDTTTIAELPQLVQQLSDTHDWNKLPPLESFSVYRNPEPNDTPRGDTVVGTTCIPDLVIELLENGGSLGEDPLEGTGAEFAYVAMDSELFPEGKQSEIRGDIEDALDEALRKSQSGRTLGGAFGVRETYIDLLLFDGDNSRQIIKETLAKLPLGSRSRLVSFV